MIWRSLAHSHLSICFCACAAGAAGLKCKYTGGQPWLYPTQSPIGVRYCSEPCQLANFKRSHHLRLPGSTLGCPEGWLSHEWPPRCAILCRHESVSVTWNGYADAASQSHAAGASWTSFCDVCVGACARATRPYLRLQSSRHFHLYGGACGACAYDCSCGDGGYCSTFPPLAWLVVALQWQ